MPDKESSIVRIDDSRRALRTAARELEDLSEAFHKVGNVLVGEQLYSISEWIVSCQEEIGKASTELLDDYGKSVRQGTFNMINGVLAGIKVGQESVKQENPHADGEIRNT